MMNKVPTSTRPDIGEDHFALALQRVNKINAVSLLENWHVVHYLRWLIEQDCKQAGMELPNNLPHKRYYLDPELKLYNPLKH